MVTEQVGLIGCGLMGVPIARRLVGHGYGVIVYDKSAEAMAQAAGFGCTTVAADPVLSVSVT